MKAAASASEAILTLLAGSQNGLPAAEIVSYVTGRYGYRANSLRTTLYNLKKRGKTGQSRDGPYIHSENIG